MSSDCPEAGPVWGEDIQLGADPVAQFTEWLADAAKTGLMYPNAMAVATATPGGMPSVRTMLLKSHGPEGFIFFTNYASPKARELDANPRAELLFYWDSLARQVRVRGPVHKVSREESEAYFHSRPRESQIGAWASPQSEVIPDRGQLLGRYQEFETKFEGLDVPLPDWGGYAVVPETIEFWIGHQHRLHDRFRYRRGAGAQWEIERLAP